MNTHDHTISKINRNTSCIYCKTYNQSLATKNAVDNIGKNSHFVHELNLVTKEIKTSFFIMSYIFAQGHSLCLFLSEQQVYFINVTKKAVDITASERKDIYALFKGLMK